jgi:4-carboxymuconolactone decarboxylase
LPLRSSADSEGEAKEILGRLEADGRDLRIVRLISNWPALVRPFVLMARTLLVNGSLPPEVREVVVLYIAKRRASAYEWAEHVPMAEAAGVSSGQRDAISALRIDDEDLFSDEQRAALALVREYLDTGAVSEGSWHRVVDLWDDARALELLTCIAWWGGFVSTLIEAIGLETP